MILTHIGRLWIRVSYIKHITYKEMYFIFIDKIILVDVFNRWLFCFVSLSKQYHLHCMKQSDIILGILSSASTLQVSPCFIFTSVSSVILALNRLFVDDLILPLLNYSCNNENNLLIYVVIFSSIL